MFRSCRKSLIAVTMALAVAIGVLGSAGSAAAGVDRPSQVSGVRVAPVPSVAWTDCIDVPGVDVTGFQCADVEVPLDYDAPSGASISLALIRLPAQDPVNRLGSLFVNPGGPGGSGVDYVRGAGKFFPGELRRGYDLIGFDPRGIGASTPLRCFDTMDEAFEALPPFAFPVTPAEERIQAQADQRLSAACATRGGPIKDHMSTANVARDLDLLRQAVGDQLLNFLGFSYGSYLGVTYANMFPATVGALVVDGVLDPIAWSTGSGTQARTQPFSTRLRSDEGAQATLRQFFKLCDAAPAGCDFAGDSRRRYEKLADRLLVAPVVLTDQMGEFTVTYADLVGNTLGSMYFAGAWPSLAEFLVEVENASSAAAVRQSLVDLRSALGLAEEPEPEYQNYVEGFPGVACSETDNPLTFAAWPTAAAKAEARYSYFGRLWTWASSICQPWPAQDADRYTGPWNRRTVTPVLVVGNYYDPATRYDGAVTASRLLPNSRLLSYAGWGHTAFMGGNACIDDAVVSYLTTTTLPRRGTVCQPDGSPFDAAVGDRRSIPSPVMVPTLPEPVRRAITRH